MDRQQRRKLIDYLREKGVPDIDIEAYIRTMKMQELAGRFQEGDEVQLDMKVITRDPNWPHKTESYRQFCQENANRIFTVEYDKRHREKPMLVCLAEDTTEPKWLFFVGDLKEANVWKDLQ